MRIAIYHGFELTGSGSNEYTRYLARALADLGHEVHVICREPHPEAVAGADIAITWDADGGHRRLRGGPPAAGTVTVHQIPHASVRPVYVTDKQRPGNVKALTDLTDAELTEVRELAGSMLGQVLSAYPVDVLHANHMVLQPTIAADVCPGLGIPFVIYPHGSDIEYTMRHDRRYLDLAGEALRSCAGLITGSEEMCRRLLGLYPELRTEILSKWEVVGVGVDTSLFTPVPRPERAMAVERLIAMDPGGGKPPALVDELHARLSGGDLAAVGQYADAYPREHPDEAIIEELRTIPWQSGRIMLFVGALTVGKGIQSLIAALPAVLEAEPETHLVIVGSGNYRETLEALVFAIAAGDEELLDRIVAIGNDLDATHMTGAWPDVSLYLASEENRQILRDAGPGFADHVHFLGRLGHEYLHELFPCVDLAIFPSILAEAYPLVLMESLSNGVLPVASDTTGLGEGLDLLEPHLGSVLVDRMRLPTDPAVRIAAIAEQVVALLQDSGTGDLGPTLRQVAVTEYDWSVRASAMVEAYRRFTAGG